MDAPGGIALDVAGGKMYWAADSGEQGRDTGKIQRSNLDGSGVEDLVTTGFWDPRGIALDVAGGKMYWTHSRAKIQRSNLDGSGVENLITGLGWPLGIALGFVPGGAGDGGDSGDEISISNVTCSGSYLFGNSGSATISITGTVYANRSVTSLTLTGFANGEHVGSHFIGILGAGKSEGFSISGIISTSGTSLDCSVLAEYSVITIGSAKVTAGDAESSEQARAQGSLSASSAPLNQNRTLEKPQEVE